MQPVQHQSRFRIGVPTYRRPGDLDVFLTAIAPQMRARSNVTLVVVNDASHDAAYQQVVDAFSDIVDYRVQAENRGCGPTRAAAFEDADEDYLVCTDDDCVPGPFWLDWIEALTEAYPAVDVFAGHIEPVWYKKPSLFERLLAIPESYPGPVVTPFGLLTAVGANTIVRRTMYEKVGGFPAEMRGAAEDCRLTQLILDAGGTYQIASDWIVGHKAENTLNGLRSRFRGYGFGGAQYTLLARDWVLAHISTDATFGQSWRAIRTKIANEWKRCGERGSPPLVRAAFSLMTGIIGFEYERGWRRGLKHFAKQYPGGLPGIPPVVERFADFSDPQALATAFGDGADAVAGHSKD